MGVMSENFRAHSIVEWFRDAPWLTRRWLRIYPRIFLAMFTLEAIVWVIASTGLVDPHGHPIGADFIDPWAASWLTLQGHPAAVYEVARLWAVEKAAVTYPGVGYAGFHYPPMYLLIVLPLALIPYTVSLAAWSVATLAAYVAVMWMIDREHDALWLAIAFPGVFVNLTCGQNGFLTVAILGGALLAIDRRPILAGMLFGLMSYKPQYAVLIPLFLIATGRWRTLIAAAVTVAAFAALSLVVFGTQTWQAFFGSISFTRHVVLEQGGSGFGKLQSAFAAMRLWGFGVNASYAMQAAVSLASAIAAVWIWRRTINPRLQAAALATGVMLMSPYMMDYDLVVLALPIAWLALLGLQSGFIPWEKSILAFAWMLPMFARTLAIDFRIPLAPPLLLMLMALIVRRTTLESSARPIVDVRARFAEG